MTGTKRKHTQRHVNVCLALLRDMNQDQPATWRQHYTDEGYWSVQLVGPNNYCYAEGRGMAKKLKLAKQLACYNFLYHHTELVHFKKLTTKKEQTTSESTIEFKKQPRQGPFIN